MFPGDNLWIFALMQESKSKPLSKLVTALAIPIVGTPAAKLLKKWFGSMSRLLVASKEELQLVPGTYLFSGFRASFHDDLS
jgi:NAD-dependent DNA ligase